MGLITQTTSYSTYMKRLAVVVAAAAVVVVAVVAAVVVVAAAAAVVAADFAAVVLVAVALLEVPASNSAVGHLQQVLVADLTYEGSSAKAAGFELGWSAGLSPPSNRK